MKVSIIGGGGLVGSCAGFALQAGKIVSEINLIDVNQELCEGQALDLLHGASLMAPQKITSSGTPRPRDRPRPSLRQCLVCLIAMIQTSEQIQCTLEPWT